MKPERAREIVDTWIETNKTLNIVGFETPEMYLIQRGKRYLPLFYIKDGIANAARSTIDQKDTTSEASLLLWLKRAEKWLNETDN
jgi:hypothetical protein